jgi:hypothetical protein
MIFGRGAYVARSLPDRVIRLIVPTVGGYTGTVTHSVA